MSNIESTLEEENMNIERWRTSFETLFPGVYHFIPPPYDLTLMNAMKDAVNIGNYNPANKSIELLDARISDVLKKA